MLKTTSVSRSRLTQQPRRARAARVHARFAPLRIGTSDLQARYSGVPIDKGGIVNRPLGTQSGADGHAQSGRPSHCGWPRGIGRVFGCALALALWTPSVALAVPATTVTCGELITQSVKLANDLTDCPAIGLEVGAAGITVDLNGHTVDGIGVDTGIDNSSAGLAPAYADVTIENGTVAGFDSGVVLTHGADKNRVRRIVATNNPAHGIHGGDADGVLVTDNTVSDSFYGLRLGTSSLITSESMKDATFERNLAVQNYDGIRIQGITTNAVVRRNTMNRNRHDGLNLVGIPKMILIDHNIANENGDEGIDSNDRGETTVVISGNRAHNNTVGGIFGQGATDGGNNRASGNGQYQCSAQFVCKP